MSNVILDTTGLRPRERFRIKVCESSTIPKSQCEYWIAENGTLWNEYKGTVAEKHSSYLAMILLHPDRIIRNPRLNADQTEIFKALMTTGYKWLAKDKDCETYHAYVISPSIHTNMDKWFSYIGGEADMSHLSPIFKSMFPPSGLADPINIAQALIKSCFPVDSKA